MDVFTKDKVLLFIKKWTPLLKSIESDDSLKSRCEKYNAYIPSDESNELTRELHFSDFLHEAYESGIVVTDYSLFTDGKEEMVENPSIDFLNSLTEKELLCCIAYHFRRDHFSEGSLINESFVNGSLLKLFESMIGK